jgi:hypothetical protein
MSQADDNRVRAHLFRADRDEHAVFLFAGAMTTAGGGQRLLVRQVVEVPDHAFGPSDRGGYRQVAANEVARAAMYCQQHGLQLMWAHSHPGATDHVGFSEPDLQTHRRAHPGLITLTGDSPVTSLVYGCDSIAGETWMPDGSVTPVDHVDIVGARMRRLHATRRAAGPAAERYARQVLMFGEAGQQRLAGMTVAVLGAGGGGSLLVQALAHLGVGHLIICDFDTVSVTNLSRIVGAEPADAAARRLKVDAMTRMVHRIDPAIKVTAIAGDVSYADDARRVAEADYIFSATDTMLGRFAFNAICHQYLIPGAQVGAKVVADPAGEISLMFAMHRPVDFSGACLECAGDIDGERLRREQLNEQERRDQDYLDSGDDKIIDPSVITLNSVATSMAMIDFQLAATGLAAAPELTQRIYHARDRRLRLREHEPRTDCRWCDHDALLGSYARGDDVPLPLKPGARPRTAPVSAPGLWRRILRKAKS